jgi:hypothetical protein
VLLVPALEAVVDPEAELNVDLKTFLVGSFPSEWITAPEIPPALEPLLPPGFDADALLAASGLGADPRATGSGAGRVRGELRLGDLVFTAHHEVFLGSTSTSALGSTSSGVGLQAPELVDLTWQPDLGTGMTLRGRTDRLSAAWSTEGVQLVVGRQPVSFGSGLVFAPMDVVNPFSAATIDTEYKPGVDAVRVDGFFSTSAKVTAVAAWAGAPIHAPDREAVALADLVFAASGQVTVGTTDLGALAAVVRGDLVGGGSVVTAVGPVGLHGDATVTLPAEDAVEDDPFVRVVVGADGRPTVTTTVSGELYLQTLGAADAAEYLAFAQGPRFARGELWTMGRYYAALSVAQELTPLVALSGAVITNLRDPSALVAPSLSVSADDDVTVSLGGFLALGARPDEVPLGFDATTFAVTAPPTVALARSVNSEFGLYPSTVFLTTRAWF